MLIIQFKKKILLGSVRFLCINHPPSFIMNLHEVKREAIRLSVRQITILFYKNAPISTMNKVKLHDLPYPNKKLILYYLISKVFIT